MAQRSTQEALLISSQGSVGKVRATQESILISLRNSTCQLSTNPAFISFAMKQGDPAPSPIQVQVLNSGNTDLIAWTLQSDQPWVTISAQAGTTPSTIQIGIDITGVPSGFHTANLTFSSIACGNPVLVVTFELNATMIASCIPDPNADAFDVPSLNGVFDDFAGLGTLVNPPGFPPGTYNFVQYNQVGPDAVAFGGELYQTLTGRLKVAMVVPDHYDDDGIGIDFQYQPWLMQMPPTVIRTAGYRAQLVGSGTIRMTPVNEERKNLYGYKEVTLTEDTPISFEKGLRATESFISLIISNKKTCGAWCQVQELVMYANPIYGGNRSPNK
jgi:hypothetical protein